MSRSVTDFPESGVFTPDQPPIERGRLTERAPAVERASQAVPGLLPESPRAGVPHEQQPAMAEHAAGPPIGSANRLGWQTVALWTFVAVSFAAFAFAGYLIRANCRGTYTLCSPRRDFVENR